MFSEIYKGKTVLITGNTGFKGNWLSAWLLKLGAKVIGVSNGIPTQPSLFEVLDMESHIQYINADVRDLESVKRILNQSSPDFVFHLAAQAIVSVSYSNPVDTFSTNVIGTVNVLEALRSYEKPCVAVMITSDKCYDNVEWIWGYKESDHIGGKDVYSGSKGAAELAIKSYYHSFFKNNHPVKIGIGRAGNVIGGGDWARDRIVVDCMLAWSKGESVEIRSPQATRPWQHVLEPLSGYLTLGAALYSESRLHGEAFNFGPKSEQNHTVIKLLEDIAQIWGFDTMEKAYRITGNIPFHEAGLLKLNCDKALSSLKWEPNLNYSETIELLAEWYMGYYKPNSSQKSMLEITYDQIDQYETIASERKRIWTK